MTAVAIHKLGLCHVFFFHGSWHSFLYECVDISLPLQELVTMCVYQTLYVDDLENSSDLELAYPPRLPFKLQNLDI